MLGLDNALGEDEIDIVEEDCAGLGEDVGGKTEADVVWVRGPGEAEDHSYNAAYTEDWPEVNDMVGGGSK